eukprot:Lankesteria_metandrocarpae@DN4658_c0_g2_i1.p1
MEDEITKALCFAYSQCKKLNTISSESPPTLNPILRKPKLRAMGTWSTNSVIRAAHSTAAIQEADINTVIKAGVARQWATALATELCSDVTTYDDNTESNADSKIQFIMKEDAEKLLLESTTDSDDPAAPKLLAVDVSGKGFINLYTMIDLRSVLLEDNVEDSVDSRNTGVSQHNQSVTFKPVAYVRSCYRNKFGTPRQSSLAASSRGVVELVRTIDGQSLQGLEDYSHCWLVWHFHDEGKSYLDTDRDTTDVPQEKATKALVHPPMLGGKSCGVFASRSPHRPCAIGLSLVKILRVSHEQRRVFISGQDLVDMTPVLDIKPVHPMDFSPLDHAPAVAPCIQRHNDNTTKIDVQPSDKECVMKYDTLRNTQLGSNTEWLSWRLPEWVKDPTAEQHCIVEIRDHVKQDLHEWIEQWRDMQTKKDVTKPGSLGGIPPFAFFDTEDDFWQTLKCSLRQDPRSPMHLRDRLGCGYQMNLDNFEVIFHIQDIADTDATTSPHKRPKHQQVAVVDTVRHSKIPQCSSNT